MDRSSLPRDILRSLGEDLDEESKKERDIITSNRVKLTEYIHDVTLLFPYMKEKGVFTVGDCDLVRAEPTGTLKVDKFVDIFLTKGPKAIGVFHEALDAHFPAVFDYLAWLFTNAGVQLPPSRQLRDRDNESTTSSLKSDTSSLMERSGQSFRRYGSRTVRKSLEVLSQQCEDVQRERDELQKSLIFREREISTLLSSRDQFQSNFLAVTQKYQELLKELGNWRDLLCNQSEGSSEKMQRLLNERKSIQQEYDNLEGEFMLVSSELTAARDRMNRLLTHLERSEAMVAITQEEKEKLKDRLEVYKGDIQRLHRKMERLTSRDGVSMASQGGGDADTRSMGEQCMELQSELERALERNKELEERLNVAHIERREAQEERDAQLSKLYKEGERRKKVERELQQLRRKQADTRSLLSCSLPAGSPEEIGNVRLEDITIVMPAPSTNDPGMSLGLGVMVRTVTENGIAANNGVKLGDEIYQVNRINLAADNPLQFAQCLLSAAQNVTLSIKRQVPVTQGTTLHNLPFTPTSPGLVNSVEQQMLMPRYSVGMLSASAFEEQSYHIMTRSHASQVSTPTTSTSAEKSHDEQSAEDREGVSEDSAIPMDCLRSGEERKPNHLFSNRNSAASVSHSENSGLITSPTPSLRDYHRDSDIPETITRYDGTTIHGRTLPEKYEPPTCILRPEEEGQGEGEEESMMLQCGDDELCPLDPNHQPPSPPRQRKRSDQQDSDDDGTKLMRGNKVIRRREKERKVSKSLDDMSQIEYSDDSPKVERKDVWGNKVVLPRGQLGQGLRLIGGRGYGVFIHSHRVSSRGLQTGDQLMKIDDKPLDNLTYAEVMEILHSYSSKQEQCLLSLRHDMDAYSRLPSSNARDSFYVRAKVSHLKNSVRNELTFEKGAIFHVVDTLPHGYPKMWRVERVGSKGEVDEVGLVPISLSPAEVMENAATSLPRFFHNFSPKQNRRNGIHTVDEQVSRKVSASTAFEIYEPIRKVKVSEPRPVVLLGALEVDIRRHLVENGSNENIKFSYCKRVPADTLGHHEDTIETLTTTDGVVMRSTVQHAQHVAKQGFHCVLCLQPEALAKPAVEQLCPIVLLLETKSLKTVKQIRTSGNIPSDRHDNPQLHLDRVKNLQKYLTYFTGRVTLPSTMREVIQVVRDTVARQQKSVIWEMEGNQMGSAMDLST